MPASPSARRGDPILFINNPPGVSGEVRRWTIEGLKALNEAAFARCGDPETRTRTRQYELALRMQGSVPELADLGKEPASTYALYGEEAKKPGTFANAALLARRMVKRGVRFVQDLSQQLGQPRQRGRSAAQPVPRRRPGLLGADPRI